MLPLKVANDWIVGLCPNEHNSQIMDVCVINADKIARIHTNSALPVKDGKYTWEVILELKCRVTYKFLSSDYDKINCTVYNFLEGKWKREAADRS